MVALGLDLSQFQTLKEQWGVGEVVFDTVPATKALSGREITACPRPEVNPGLQILNLLVWYLYELGKNQQLHWSE